MAKKLCWVADYGEIREAFIMSVCKQTGWYTVHFLDDFMRFGDVDPNSGYQGMRSPPCAVWPNDAYPSSQWADNLECLHAPRKWGHSPIEQ